jgi:hypothetical protein
MDSIIMDWGIPFTAMHLSSLDGPTGSRTVLVLSDPSVYDAYLGREDYFLTPFKAMKNSELNGKYYRLVPGTYLRQSDF